MDFVVRYVRFWLKNTDYTDFLPQISQITRSLFLPRIDTNKHEIYRNHGFYGFIAKKKHKNAQKGQKNDQKVLYKHVSSAALHAAEIPYRQVNMTKGARFVLYYSVQRRQVESNGNGQIPVGPWCNVTSATDNEIALKTEPTGSRLEYRVKAVNKGGESYPSNTISVIL